jgi:hypothetical protein
MSIWDMAEALELSVVQCLCGYRIEPLYSLRDTNAFMLMIESDQDRKRCRTMMMSDGSYYYILVTDK